MDIDIPPWLEVPAKYYKTGANFRSLLLKHIAGKELDPDLLNSAISILEQFHVAALILDDICDDASERRNQKTLHLLHGKNQGTIWALALTFHIHEFIHKRFPKELAGNMSQLYNKMTLLTLEGQFYDMDFGNQDYAKIVYYKTSYYTTCFPVAMYVLLTTNDLNQALEIMENPTLLDIGYFFQAENDFRGNFEEANTDIENRTWTVLVDLAAKQFPPGEFIYPQTREKATELYKETDAYDAYIRLRTNWFKTVGSKVEELPVVRQAQEFCVKYFKSEYVHKGLSFKMPELEGLKFHPEQNRILELVSEWGKQENADKYLNEPGLVQLVSNMYHFVPVSIVAEIQKLSILVGLAHNSGHLKALLKIESLSLADDPELQDSPKMPTLTDQINFTSENLSVMLNTNVLDHVQEWIKSQGKSSLNFQSRWLHLSAALFCQFGPAFYGIEPVPEIPKLKLYKLLCLQIVFHELTTVDPSNIENTGTPIGVRQEAVIEIQAEEAKLVKCVQKMKGTELEFMISAYQAFANYVHDKPSAIISKNTALISI